MSHNLSKRATECTVCNAVTPKNVSLTGRIHVFTHIDKTIACTVAFIQVVEQPAIQQLIEPLYVSMAFMY